jgi:ABC-type Fe3+-hydroxamate transport system substrate-binding protein
MIWSFSPIPWLTWIFPDVEAQKVFAEIYSSLKKAQTRVRSVNDPHFAVLILAVKPMSWLMGVV